METFIEIIKVILPSIIAAISTFVITKYKYNKNVPLDKMEIAYNRIYYPIYKILNAEKNNSNNIEHVIMKITPYLMKYNKYVDSATLKAFRLLKKFKDDSAFENFRNNIYNKNSFLRRRLGYLEPNLFQIYTYSSKNEKSTLRILIEFVIIYIAFMIGSLTKNAIQIICAYFVIIFAIISIVELFVLLIRWLSKRRERIIKK